MAVDKPKRALSRYIKWPNKLLSFQNKQPQSHTIQLMPWHELDGELEERSDGAINWNNCNWRLEQTGIVALIGGIRSISSVVLGGALADAVFRSNCSVNHL